MIEIKREAKTKGGKTPYYILTYNYMIGDANGNTTETVKVSVDNPFLERYVTLLNGLQPTKWKWGVMLEENRLLKHFNEGQISEDDHNFLSKLMFEESEVEFEISEDDESYSMEFMRGVRGMNEYSFLIFEGLDLHYVDEFGKNMKQLLYNNG
jgi:hypothetical protein